MAIYYWAWIGTLYLIFLTYQDLRHKMMVDERYNYFMMGLTFSLLSHIKVKWWAVFIYFLAIGAFCVLVKRLGYFGDADIQTFSWLFFGYMIIGIWDFVVFGLALTAITAIFFSLKLLFKAQQKEAPFYPVFLASFVFACFYLGIYIG